MTDLRDFSNHTLEIVLTVLNRFPKRDKNENIQKEIQELLKKRHLHGQFYGD